MRLSLRLSLSPGLKDRAATALYSLTRQHISWAMLHIWTSFPFQVRPSSSCSYSWVRKKRARRRLTAKETETERLSKREAKNINIGKNRSFRRKKVSCGDGNINGVSTFIADSLAQKIGRKGQICYIGWCLCVYWPFNQCEVTCQVHCLHFPTVRTHIRQVWLVWGGGVF